MIHIYHRISIVGYVTGNTCIATQNGGVKGPVALSQGSLGTSKTALHPYAAFHRKRNVPICSRRPVSALSHPDRIAFGGLLECRLQIGIGMEPRSTVVLTRCSGVYVDARLPKSKNRNKK